MSKKTMTLKLFEKKLQKELKIGEFVLVEVDKALGNDITAPVAINEFEKINNECPVYDPDQIILVPDHFTPNKDIKSAMQVKKVREFAKKYNIKNFFEVGRVGIEHVLLPEQGLVKSWDIVVGADSHTCTYGALGAFSTGVGSTDLAGVFLTGKAWFKIPESLGVRLKGKFNKYVSGKDLILKLIKILGVNGANYKAIEFFGEGVTNISMDSRFTISNMAIEAGGKAGIFPIDHITKEYEKQRGFDVETLEPDEDAPFIKILEIDLSEIKSQVAYPFLPSNCKDIDEAYEDKIKIDQVVIGSCTNGRISDLREAAEIIKGHKVAEHVRCIIFPGTQEIYKQAISEGLIQVFLDAQCAIAPPTCGPCLGGHMGILAEGEKAVSTTNRNFVGRMGHIKSEVYLASPAVAAASAVAGIIAGPENL